MRQDTYFEKCRVGQFIYHAVLSLDGLVSHIMFSCFILVTNVSLTVPCFDSRSLTPISTI